METSTVRFYDPVARGTIAMARQNAHPKPVGDFLAGKRIVVAGVSRAGAAPANAIFRRLRDCGHEVIAVNPRASELEGQACYPDVRSVPDPVHGVMVVTHPSVSADVARQALDRGVKHIWIHRSFGSGSVADGAVEECRSRGVEPIVGGCPLMYCEPVDGGHRFFRWWLRLWRRVPG
jgi:predicted CoA-binding protein